jgi:hypothetical protein
LTMTSVSTPLSLLSWSMVFHTLTFIFKPQMPVMGI